MRAFSVILFLVLLAGCAMHREVFVSLQCHDCRTPYGGGTLVNMTINKVYDSCGAKGDKESIKGYSQSQ